MRKLLFILPLLATLTLSCEGYKAMVIQNASAHPARVTIRPGLDSTQYVITRGLVSFSGVDSAAFTLPPDSLLYVLSRLTTMMVKPKVLQEGELRINYLRIESERDTVVANSRAEIMQLLQGGRGSLKGDSVRQSRITIQ